MRLEAGGELAIIAGLARLPVRLYFTGYMMVVPLIGILNERNNQV